MDLVDDLDRFAKLLASVKVSGKARALSPVEVANDIQRMLDEDQTVERVAQRLTVSKDWVNTLLKPAKIPKELQNAIVWGRTTDIGISFSTAELAVLLDEQEDMRVLLEAAMKYKFTKIEIENIIKLKKDGFSIRECIVKVKKIRPVIEHKYMYVITVNPQTITQLRQASDAQNLMPAEYLKGMLATHLKSENILAVTVKGQNIAISLNMVGNSIFSSMLNSKGLTIGNSISYLLGEYDGD